MKIYASRYCAALQIGEVARFIWTSLTIYLRCSWAHVFEDDLFKEVKREAMDIIKTLLETIRKDVPERLQGRYLAQAEIAKNDARVSGAISSRHDQPTELLSGCSR